jgi:hypothetical protein
MMHSDFPALYGNAFVYAARAISWLMDGDDGDDDDDDDDCDGDFIVLNVDDIVEEE